MIDIDDFLAAELLSIRIRAVTLLDAWGYYGSDSIDTVLDRAGAAAIHQLATSDDIREALCVLAARQVCKDLVYIDDLPMLLRSALEEYECGSRDALGVLLRKSVDDWGSKNVH